MWKSISKIWCILISLIIAILFSGCIYETPEMSSNSGCVLGIVNYLGNTQNIHPKVLYFEEGWHGYRFWMAYTPYPNGSTSAENPCIAVSNDGIHWSAPHGLVNPLAFAPKKGYNSDTHLVYDSINDRLECWWREYNIPSASDAICRRRSSNGVTWSIREVVLPYNPDQKGRLSPAVWIEDGEYKMVFSNGRVLKYMSRPLDSTQWSSPVELPIEWGSLHAWHHDIITDADGSRELVVCAFTDGGSNNSADLYYVRMNHEMSEASVPVMIISRGSHKDDFDYRSIYRSSIVRIDGKVWIYYSAINKDWRRYMSLMLGPSPFDLEGLPSQ